MLKKRPYILLLAIASIVIAFLFVACEGRSRSESEYYTVGLITNNTYGMKNIQGFRDEMKELGYIEGENITYLFAEMPLKGKNLDAAFEEMVAQDVDLIFAAGTPAGVAAHRITADTDTPVVFGVIADPINAGVMDDLTNPGGNITGIKLSDTQGRRLELLLEVAPDIERIFVAYNPANSASTSAMAQIVDLTSVFGIEIVEGLAHSDEEALNILADLPEDIDAVFMLPDNMINMCIDKLVESAIERKLPVSAPSMIQIESGVLMAYGIIHQEVGAQAAPIADQILKGVDPGTIPVQTAEYYLGINLQTAQAIGIEIPQPLVQAAEVIVTLEE